MVQRVRKNSTQSAMSERFVAHLPKARLAPSRKKVALGLSAMLVAIAVPASASSIRNHLGNSPDLTVENTDKDVRSQTNASIQLESESRITDDADNSLPTSHTDVRINGQSVPLPEDGRYNRTIETENGRTNIDIQVHNNTSADVDENQTDSRTRIRVDTDSDFRSSVYEDLKVEIDE